MERGKAAVEWLGKRCPACGGRSLQVKDSRISKRWRRRTKRCLNCGATGLTLEVPATKAHRAALKQVWEEGGWQTSLLHTGKARKR